MNVALPSNLEDYVAQLVQTSGYKCADEVVSEALREHRSRRQGMEVVMTPELERLLDEGVENLDQSKTTAELRRRSRLTLGSARKLNGTWRRFSIILPGTIPMPQSAYGKLS